MRPFAGSCSTARLDAAARTRAALACLASPPSLLAVGLLLLNDHVLKALCPSWVTGKLSDFAGLYFSPYLLLAVACSALWLARAVGAGLAPVRTASDAPAHLPLVRSARASDSASDALAAFAFVAVGGTFAALKLSPLTAAPILGLAEATLGWRPLVAADPSDLLALAVLPPAWLGWQRHATAASQTPSPSRPSAGRSRIGLRRAGELLALAVATLTVVATTPAPPPTWPLKSSAQVGIAADPWHPEVLYATTAEFIQQGQGGKVERTAPDATWLHRSADGGDSWRTANPGGERVLPDPLRQGVFYLLWLDGVWRLDEPSGARTRLWPPPDRVPERMPGRDGLGLPTDAPPWSQGTLYVGARAAVMRSRDGGATWTALSLPGPAESYVTALAAAGSTPGSLFAVKDQRLYHSLDWGDTWASVAALSGSVDVLKVHPRDPGLLLGATGRELIRSADAGASWKVVWSAPSGSGGVSSIVFDPESDGVVYVAARDDGLLVSGDAGQSWGKRFEEDVADVTVARSPNHRAYVITVHHGVFRQRGAIRWPWLREWEPLPRGPGSPPRGFGDQVVNLLSWLGFLTAVVVAVRLLAPGRLRPLVRPHVWEALLVAWGLAQCAVLVDALASGGQGDRFSDAEMLAGLAALGLLVVVARVRLSWVALALVAPPLALTVPLLVADGGIWVYSGAVVAVTAAALAGAAYAIWRDGRGLTGRARARAERLARAGLILAIVLGNALGWFLWVAGLALGGSWMGSPLLD